MKSDLLKVERLRKSENAFILHVRVYKTSNVKPCSVLDIHKPFYDLSQLLDLKFREYGTYEAELPLRDQCSRHTNS
jgi:hypothetical protein